jgi:hypothetical protein
LEFVCRSQAAAGYCRLNTSDCTSGAYYGEVGLDECGAGPCGGKNQEWTAIKSKASKGGFVFKSALEGSTASAKCYMLNIPADLSLGSAQVVAFGDASCDTGSIQSDFVSAATGVLETKGFPTPSCSSRDGCCVQAAPWSNTTSNTTFSPLAMAVCDATAQPLQQFEFDDLKGDHPGRIRDKATGRCLSIKNCALDVGPHTGPQPGPPQCDDDSYQIFLKPGNMYSRFLRLHDGRVLMTFTHRTCQWVDNDGWGAGSRALLSYDDGLSWDVDHDYMVLNAEDDFFPRGLLPSPTPTPSTFCKGWLLPPGPASSSGSGYGTEMANGVNSSSQPEVDHSPLVAPGQQCGKQQWRWGSIWGTIGEQHGVLRQFTPPNGSCDPAVRQFPSFRLCPCRFVFTHCCLTADI